MRDFMREYDLELSDKAQTVISPFTSSALSSSKSSSDSSDSTTALIPADRITPFATSGPIISSRSSGSSSDSGKSIVFSSGSAHAQGTGGSPYLVPVLRAPRGAFLVDEAELVQGGDEAASKSTGKEGKGAAGNGYDTLVSVFQTRDNARAGFVGSVEMLADTYWSDK